MKIKFYLKVIHLSTKNDATTKNDEINEENNKKS